MSDYSTCFIGCSCEECRQRRSDYWLVQSVANDYEEEIFDDRLESAMDNLGYSKHKKKAIKDYRK